VSTGHARKKVSPKKKLRDELANHEVVVLAAYLAGAQKISADTKDIAIKASQLAPGRFCWRKYKDQINIDTVRKRLWDATKEDKGAYLIGSERTGSANGEVGTVPCRPPQACANTLTASLASLEVLVVAEGHNWPTPGLDTRLN
jgi:hypothetical protein